MAVASIVVAAGAGPAHAQVERAAVTIMHVPCDPRALAGAVRGANAGAAQTLSLAPRCRYVLTKGLPVVRSALAIRGHDATLERSHAAGTPPFTILVDEGELSISHLNFRNGAGAITVRGTGTLSVRGGTFSDNKAVAGGAISDTSAYGLRIEGATFTANTAAESGGALYDRSRFGSVVRDSTFVGNAAAVSGGAIAGFGAATERVLRSSFVGNRAQYGGAMALSPQTASYLWRVVVEDNVAANQGAGLLSFGNADVEDSRFFGNRAGQAGGGIFMLNGGESSVAGTRVRWNSAANGGGLFNCNEILLRFTGGVLADNRSSANGGGAYNCAGAGIAFAGTAIEGNRAGGDGGGVYNQTSGLHVSHVSVQRSLVLANDARGLGGGVYNQASLAAVGTEIADNTATRGGGIYDDGSSAAARLSAAVVSRNRPDNCEPAGSIRGCAG